MNDVVDRETQIRAVEDACDKIRHWFLDGKKIQGYQEARGKALMANLVGYDWSAIGKNVDADHWYPPLYNIATQINGPHGWAILQTYIVKNRKMEEQNEIDTSIQL